MASPQQPIPWLKATNIPTKQYHNWIPQSSQPVLDQNQSLEVPMDYQGYETDEKIPQNLKTQNLMSMTSLQPPIPMDCECEADVDDYDQKMDTDEVDGINPFMSKLKSVDYKVMNTKEVPISTFQIQLDLSQSPKLTYPVVCTGSLLGINKNGKTIVSVPVVVKI